MTPDELERKKREIDILIEERWAAIEAAGAWMRDWKARQARRGFRCTEESNVG